MTQNANSAQQRDGNSLIQAAILADSEITGPSWPASLLFAHLFVEVRAAWRLCRLCLYALHVLVIMRFRAPRMSTVRLEELKQRWSTQALRILGVHLRAEPLDLPARALIVSNHISWIDIFVVSAMTQTHFVCKDEIRKWPFIGWFVTATGTIFISRSSRTDAARTAKALGERLQRGERVAFFPEGTTTNGTTLLPFSAALFDAATPAQACVVPMALRYLNPNGTLSLAPAYDGDISFVECLRSIVKAHGIVAELIALPAIPSGLGRREYASIAREKIADALRLS